MNASISRRFYVLMGLVDGLSGMPGAHAQQAGTNLDNYTISSQFNGTSYGLDNPLAPIRYIEVRQKNGKTQITFSDSQGGTFECKIEKGEAVRTNVWIIPGGRDNAPMGKPEKIDPQALELFADEFSRFTAGGTKNFPLEHVINLPDSLQKAVEEALGPKLDCLHPHSDLNSMAEPISMRIGKLAYMTQPGIRYTNG